MKSGFIRVVRTAIFSRRTKKLLTENEIDALSAFLAAHSYSGKVIPGTGGLRKVRWALAGRGKRGGCRVIYYYHVAGELILLLTVYAKNEQDDLTADDKRALAQAVQIF